MTGGPSRGKGAPPPSWQLRLYIAGQTERRSGR